MKKEQVTVFETIIKETENMFILGRISGMLASFMDDHYAMRTVMFGDEPAMLVKMRGTLTNYKKAQKVIERHYPYKCNFNVSVGQYFIEESN